MKEQQPVAPAPHRIAHEDGPAGELVRSAERAFDLGLPEGDAWKKLERRRGRRILFWTLPMAAALTIALVASGARWRARRQADTLRIEPDRIFVSAVDRAPDAPPPPPPPAPAAPAPTAATAEPTRIARAAHPMTPYVRAVATPSEASCQRLVASGNADRAVDCFLSLAQGSGVGAEVALYQAIRASAEQPAETRRTLALLDEHRTRFPDGAMRGEVDWLRVRTLDRTGRFEEALAESERLLATPSGRTLAPELHMVRGRIYQDAVNDCGRAASEFVALVGEPGPRGDEAELRRARCLEKMGRFGQAEVAYTQYLRRAEAAHAGEARERLHALAERGTQPEGAP